MPFARLLAAAISALAIPGAMTTTIHAEPLRTGAKASLELTSVVAITIDVQVRGETRKQIDLPGELKLRCTATVTAADEEGPTLATVAFGRVERLEKDSMSRPAVAKEPRTSNSRYELTRAQSGFEAKGVRGDLDREEKESVAAVAALALGVPPLGTWLDGRSPQKGQHFEPPLEVGRKILPLLDPSVALESLTLTGEGTRKLGALEVVVFGVAATLVSSDRSDMDASVELSGELLLSPMNGQVVSIALSGSVATSASTEEGGQHLDLKGKGTWKYAYTARFE